VKLLHKFLIFQIILAVLILLIVIFYLVQRNTNILPHTEVFITNTTIIGRVLGV